MTATPIPRITIDPLDQQIDYAYLLHQVRQIKSDPKTSFPQKAELFHRTIVQQIKTSARIERDHMDRYRRLSNESKDLQIAYEKINNKLNRELRRVKAQNAELRDTRATLQLLEKDCKAKEEYIESAEQANAVLKDKNKEQRDSIKTWKKQLQEVKKELEVRDKTVEDLQQLLVGKGALVDKYQKEIEQCRIQLREWERQVDQAPQHWEDRGKMAMAPPDDVGEVTRSSHKLSYTGTSSSEGSNFDPFGSDRSSLLTSSTCPTSYDSDEAWNESFHAKGSDVDSVTAESAMDCSDDHMDEGSFEPSRGTTLDDDIKRLSDSLSALQLDAEFQMEWEPIRIEDTYSPLSEYDLSIHQRSWNRHFSEQEKQQCEQEDRKDHHHPDRTSKKDRSDGNSLSLEKKKLSVMGAMDGTYDVPDSPYEPPELVPTNNMPNLSDEAEPTTDTNQPTAVELGGELPRVLSQREPTLLLANGRIGYYKDPIWLSKPFQRSEPSPLNSDPVKPRTISMINPVLRIRVEPQISDYDENLMIVDQDSQHGCESLLTACSPIGCEAGASDSEPSETDINSTEARGKDEVQVAINPSLVLGRKWWLSLLMGIVLLVITVVQGMTTTTTTTTTTEDPRRLWNKINTLAQDPFARLQRNPEARASSVRASQYKVFPLSHRDLLSFG